MRIVKKTTIDRIISKVYNDFGLDELEESVIVEWTGDVLAQLDINRAYIERVSFLEVKNHQVEIPNDIISLISISKNNNYKPKSCETSYTDTCTCSCKEEVEVECVEDIYMLRDCMGKLLLPEGYEKQYFTTNFKLDTRYKDLVSSNSLKDCFTTLKPSNSAFKSINICNEGNECINSLYSPNEPEFTVIGNYFRFSFKEGQIVISYLAQPIDYETGYPLIPDDVSIINAITNYILFMYCRKMHIIGRDGYKEKYQEAEKDYEWYLSQAKNKFYGLYGIEEHKEFTKKYLGVLPKAFK